MEKIRDGNNQERETLGRGESQKGEEEKVRREKMQVREKVGKSRNTVFSNVLWLPTVQK